MYTHCDKCGSDYHDTRDCAPKPEHDWKITAWEYDDTFFQCARCGKKTNSRRGYPEKAGCHP